MANQNNELLDDINSSLQRTGNALTGLKESDPELYYELFCDSDEDNHKSSK